MNEQIEHQIEQPEMTDMQDMSGSGGMMNPYGQLMPRPPATDASVSKWTLNNEDLIERLVHYLKREMWDRKAKSWAGIHGVSPLCNDNFIADLVSIIDSYANKSNILSDLDEDKINEFTWNVMVELCGAIYVNGLHYYGIVNPTDKDLIVNMVYVNVFCALRRAWEGRERRSRQVWMNVQEVQRFDGGKKEGGIMSGMFPSFRSNK
jgi:hypothetical protein